MDTLKGKPPVSLSAAEPGRRARRPWVWLVAVAVLLATIGGGVYVSRYQPLEKGSVFASGPDSSGLPSHPSFGGPQTAILTYRDGGVTSFGFSIRNTGPWGVTVTGIETETDPAWVGLIRITGARLQETLNWYTADLAHTVPFHPFSLGSGDERFIVVVARFGNCKAWGVQSGMTIGAIAVRFRVLGILHHSDIELPYGVEVPSPPNSACPERSR